MAQLERVIIAERVKGGLRRARERGKKLGRPKAEVDPVEVKWLRGEGLSFSKSPRGFTTLTATAGGGIFPRPK